MTQVEEKLAAALKEDNKSLWDNRELIFNLWRQMEEEASERNSNPFYWSSSFYYPLMEYYGQFIPFDDLRAVFRGDLTRAMRWPRTVSEEVQTYNGGGFKEYDTDTLYKLCGLQKINLMDLI